MMKRPGYLAEFVNFWNAKNETKRIWFSLFTPQKGASAPEILSAEERQQTISELLRLRRLYPKLDMRESVIREFLHPPASPEECIFALTTRTISADLKSAITPCQFGAWALLLTVWLRCLHGTGGHR